MTSPPPTRRHWFQFGLRRLLAFVVLVAIAAAWVGYERRQSAFEMKVADWLRSQHARVDLTGRFFYSDEFDPPLSASGATPTWWRKTLSTLCGPRIRSVNVSGWPSEFNDLTPLAGLKSIRELDISFMPVKDLTPLAELKSLEWIAFLPSGDWEIEVKPLAGLKKLKHLELFGHVKGIKPLAGLVQLEYLTLRIDNLDDLSPIAGLAKIKDLNLTRTRIVDLAPIAGFTDLESLNLTDTLVSDFEPIAGLTNLETLYLYEAPGRDITPLVGLTNLRKLHVSHHRISDKKVAAIKAALPNCEVFVGIRGDMEAADDAED